MQPIINPLFIYLLSIIETLKGAMSAFIFIGTVVCILTGLILFAEHSNSEMKSMYTIFKRTTITTTILAALYIFIPDKNTLIAMYATKYITVDNIKYGKEIVVDSIKEIVEIIKNKEEK